MITQPERRLQFASSTAHRGFAAVVGIAMLLALFASACGGSDTDVGAPGFQRVIPADKVFTIDDVVAAGAKQSKAYDVAGLTGATASYLAFFGPNASSRYDVELRFYPSHAVAVSDGESFAAEGVGEGMRAAKETQRWAAGAKDRWFVGGVTDISSAGSRQAPGPKYGDYMIYGNIVMLCQGADDKQSLERCGSLIEAMGGPKAK